MVDDGQPQHQLSAGGHHRAFSVNNNNGNRKPLALLLQTNDDAEATEKSKVHRGEGRTVDEESFLSTFAPEDEAPQNAIDENPLEAAKRVDEKLGISDYWRQTTQRYLMTSQKSSTADSSLPGGTSPATGINIDGSATSTTTTMRSPITTASPSVFSPETTTTMGKTIPLILSTITTLKGDPGSRSASGFKVPALSQNTESANKLGSQQNPVGQNNNSATEQPGGKSWTTVEEGAAVRKYLNQLHNDNKHLRDQQQQQQLENRPPPLQQTSVSPVSHHDVIQIEHTGDSGSIVKKADSEAGEETILQPPPNLVLETGIKLNSNRNGNLNTEVVRPVAERHEHEVVVHNNPTNGLIGIGDIVEKTPNDRRPSAETVDSQQRASPSTTTSLTGGSRSSSLSSSASNNAPQNAADDSTKVGLVTSLETPNFPPNLVVEGDSQKQQIATTTTTVAFTGDNNVVQQSSLSSSEVPLPPSRQHQQKQSMGQHHRKTTTKSLPSQVGDQDNNTILKPNNNNGTTLIAAGSGGSWLLRTFEAQLQRRGLLLFVVPILVILAMVGTRYTCVQILMNFDNVRL
jgi:hypothetical protein